MNIPEKWELLDERDKLREEPETTWTRAQLRVVNFMLALRRGTLGPRELTRGEKEIADALYLREVTETQSE